MLDLLRDSLAFLLQPPVLMVVVAWAISFNLTQFVKHVPSIYELEERRRRLVIRAWSTIFGAVPAFFLMPEGPTPLAAVFIALAVGLSWPFAYKAGTAFFYNYFPWLEKALSASPPDDIDPPGPPPGVTKEKGR